jgi:hypothetical protein
MKKGPDMISEFINKHFKLILIILAILFAVYVWPTPYRDMPNYNIGNSHIPFRMHRITGIGELWFPGTGWKAMK